MLFSGPIISIILFKHSSMNLPREMRYSDVMRLILCLVSLATADHNTMTDKILKDILKDYNAGSRPVGHVSDK